MASEPNYYELLGVDRYANSYAIDEAYRQQVERNHPNNGGNRAVFAMIENAYNVLSNPISRTAYDDRLDMTPPNGVQIPSDAFDEPTRTFSNTDLDLDVYSDAGDYGSHRGYDDYSGRDEPTSPAPREQKVEHDLRPIFVRDPDIDNQVPRYMPQLTSVKHVVWAAVFVWVVLAIITPLPIIPGVSDGAAILMLIWFFLAWWLLSFGLRMVGLIAIFITIVQWLGGGLESNDAVPRIAAGFAVWLVGHWVFTWRHGRWKSVIAHLLLGKLPGPIRPDRRQQLGYDM